MQGPWCCRGFGVLGCGDTEALTTQGGQRLSSLPPLGEPKFSVGGVEGMKRASDGNRTRVSSLGSWRSTIELRSRAPVSESARRRSRGASRARAGPVGANRESSRPRPTHSNRGPRPQVSAVACHCAALRQGHPRRNRIRSGASGPLGPLDGPAVQRRRPARQVFPALRQPPLPLHRPGGRTTRPHPARRSRPDIGITGLIGDGRDGSGRGSNGRHRRGPIRPAPGRIRPRLHP